jgi:carboxyl-terminal processing protease
VPSPRRALRAAAVVAAVGVAYGAGVVTGVAGSRTQPENNGVIDEAAARIADRAERPVARQQLERAAVEGMLKSLGDKWSNYYQPGDYASFQDSLEGRYSGVGLWLRPGDGGVDVGSVAPGSPAATSGAQPGDRVVSVDGVVVPADGIAAVSDAAARLRGRPGTTVNLVVARAGASRTLTMVRRDFGTEDVTLTRLRGGVTIVKVAAFSRGVGREVRQGLAADPSAHARGVVLDLRDDPGGLLDEAVETASDFLDGGPVVSYERRGQPAQTLSALTPGDTATPLVVLVDRGTASAAEIVAAALQDRSRAVVVGSRTFGKGSVQEPTKLSDGSAIELTVGRYLTPSGRSLDGVGVDPDVLVPDGQPTVAEQRALDVLSGLLAALGGGGKG